METCVWKHGNEHKTRNKIDIIMILNESKLKAAIKTKIVYLIPFNT